MWSSELHFVKVQFTKPFFVRESEYNDKVMEMGKTRLFTLTNGLNNMNEWYVLNRRRCRKFLLKIISYYFIIYNYNF